MHENRYAVLSSLLATATLTGQAVLTVGPTGQFADLPQAVAAAQPGDTVRCLTPPSFQLYTAPVLTRGITLDCGHVHGLLGQLVIDGIPAGEHVTVQNLLTYEPQRVLVRDCAGRVHLEQLVCSTGHIGPVTTPTIQIERCDAVSLNGVQSHGSPAITVTDSTVAINHGWLGIVAGGNEAVGRTIEGLRSVISITQPTANVGSLPTSAMHFELCDVTITGRWNSFGNGSIRGGHFNQTFYPAIEGIGSTLTLAPNIGLTGAITGFPQITMHELPYHRVFADRPGGLTPMQTFGPVHAVGVAALNTFALPAPSPLGNLWLDPVGAPTYVFQIQTNGHHMLSVPMPATIPVGTPFTLQAVLLTTAGFELSLPASFVVTS